MGFSWFTEIIPKYNWVVESPYTANNHGFGHCSFGIWYGRLRPTFTEYLVERILWNIETSQLFWCFARSQCGCFFVCRWNFGVFVPSSDLMTVMSQTRTNVIQCPKTNYTCKWSYFTCASEHYLFDDSACYNLPPYMRPSIYSIQVVSNVLLIFYSGKFDQIVLDWLGINTSCWCFVNEVQRSKVLGFNGCIA